MLYICCREADGYQQVSNECAAATTVHLGPGCRRNQAGHPAGTACTEASFEAGRIGEAVWAEPSPRSGGLAPTRGRGVGRVLSAQRHGCGGVNARGYRRGVPNQDDAGNNGPSVSRPKDGRGRLSKGRASVEPNRQRSESGTLGRTELGISRDTVRSCRIAAFVEHRQDTESSRAPISPGWIRSSGLQAGISKRPSRDPRSLPESGRRDSGDGFTNALVRVRQGYRFLCSTNHGRTHQRRFCQVGRLAGRLGRRVWGFAKSNPNFLRNHRELGGRSSLAFQGRFFRFMSGSDSVVTFLFAESLIPNKSGSAVLFGSPQRVLEFARLSITSTELSRLTIDPALAARFLRKPVHLRS